MPVVVIDTIKPKNNLTFPIVEDVDVLIKASGARLSEVVANMATAEQIAALQTAIAGKASIESVTALTSLVNTKADAADLTALSATVEGKADVTDLEALQADIADKADVADLTALEAEVDTKADSSDLTTATANLQAQIDEIVTPVTQDAEVQTARVGEDGISHASLKTRLDFEFTQIKDESNIYDYTKSTDNTKLNGLGQVEEQTGLFTSGFMAVEEGVKYYKSIDNSNVVYRVCGYDNDRNWNEFATTDQNFTVPAGTKYIRICGPSAQLNNAYVLGVSAKDAKVRNIAALLESHIDSIENEIFATPNHTKISEIANIKTFLKNNATYSSSFTSIGASDNYDSYYFITDKEYTIWVDTVEAAYFAIVYGQNVSKTVVSSGSTAVFYSGTSARLRTTDNNLPTVNSKLTVPRGSLLCFTVTAGKNQTIYGINGANFVKADFANQIAPLAIDALTDTAGKTYTDTSTYDATYDSKYAGADGLHSSEDYISWGFTLTADTDLYVKENNNLYFSVCVYDSDQLDNGVRYRHYQSEDNLPYQNNPVSLTQGQYVIITCNKQNTYFEVVLDDIPEIASFNKDIPLADNHIKQVAKQLSGKDCLLRYVSGGAGTITEKVEVYIPTGVGYVRYDFTHNVDATINANVWRVNNAYACDKNFYQRYMLTAGGEWECAVHLKDRTDFSGGIAHGDEVMNEVIFFIDGGQIEDITDYTELTGFKNFVAVEASELYDPDDSETKIAKHGSEHIFNIDGLKINQSLLWLSAYDVTSCFLAMHTPSKTVTDHMYVDTSVIPFEITYDDPIEFPAARRAIVYGEESGVRSEFSIGAYPELEHGNYLFVTDNSGSNYNKCYYAVTTNSSVTTNTLWKAQSIYKFDVNL